MLHRLLALLILCASAASVPAAERTVKVTFLLVSDLYEMGEQNGRGGFARVAAVLAAERAKGGNLIVAHAGDTISPSLYSGFDKGAHIIALTSLLAPDVFVPGNHEYDFGEEVFRARMAEAGFPRLAANLRDAHGARLDGFADTLMLERDGVRIGIVGITADDAPVRSSPGTLRFLPSVDTARKSAAELRAAGADLVVAVAHASRHDDIRLVYGHDLDILLSGDDHDLAILYDGRTAMAEAMSDGAVVAAIDLDVTVKEGDGGRAVSWWPRFRVIDTADVVPDTAMAAKVAALEAELSADLDVALGSTATPLDSRKAVVRAGEAAIGNLVADAIREASGAEVAFFNGGGIRGDRTYEAGAALTRRDVLTELPFGNRIVKMKLSGADLVRALENSLRALGKPDGRFLQVSGLRIVADPDKVPGSRIESVTVAGEPLDPGRLYLAATNDFVASGKEGYGMLAGAERIVREGDGELVANAVMAYVRKAGSVAPKVEGRITVR